MDFSVTRNGVNIYHDRKNAELLTCSEVKEIRDTIAEIMDGTITQNKRFGYIEIGYLF